jgi:hypothetical protein
MSANIKATNTEAIIGVNGGNQLTISDAGVVTANSFVGNVTGNITGNVTGNVTGGGTFSGNASSATALATGSTTARTLANRFADMANVRDFGAVGDGTTNDITAFVDAADTGKQVFVPDGTYTITVSNQTQATSIMSMMERLHLFCTLLTINFNAGVYTFANRTTFNVTNGEKLKINGASPTVLSFTSVLSISSTGAGNHDVTYTVADASSVNTNDFILIRPATSAGIIAGDFTGALGGVWKVTSKSGNNITVKNTSPKASLTGATISCPTGGVIFVKMNTIFNYTTVNSIGLYVKTKLGTDSGNTSSIGNVVISGGWTPGASVSSNAGVYLEYGASISCVAEFGVHGFSGNGIYSLYGGILNAANVCASANGTNGFYALNGSIFQLVRAQATGNGSTGIVSSSNSTVAASQSASSGNTTGFFASGGSSIICNYGDARFNDSYGFTSRANSSIDALGSRSVSNTQGVHAIQTSIIDFTSGTATSNLTNFIEDEAISKIYGAVNPTGARAEKSHNFGTILANTIATTTITVPNVSIGDVVAVGWNGADVTGLMVSARASATDTITIYAANITTGSIIVGNRTYYVAILKR